MNVNAVDKLKWVRDILMTDKQMKQRIENLLKAGLTNEDICQILEIEIWQIISGVAQ